MLNNLIITVDKEEFVLVIDGKLDIERFLDLDIDNLQKAVEYLEVMNLENIDISTILFKLCKKILQQKAYISELEGDLHS